MHHRISLALLFLLVGLWPLYFVVAQVAVNVTIDDDSPRISYQPPDAWFMSENSTLDHGYAHMLTQTPNSTATFNFTGVAIYFLSPLWPYHVTTALSLDSGPTILVDLIDRSRPETGGGGPETVQSHVVWAAEDLNNTQHTLVMSIGDQEPFGIVDGLIYTILEEESEDSEGGDGSTAVDPSSIQTSTLSSSSSISSFPTSGPIPTTPDPSSVRRTHIVVGTVLGCLGLLIVALFIWFCARRRKRPRSEAWTIASGSRSTMPPISKPTRPQPMYLDPTKFPTPTLYPVSEVDNPLWEEQHYRYGFPTGHATSSTSPPASPPMASHFSGGAGLAGIGSKSVSPTTPRYLHGNTLSTIVENSPATAGTSSLPRTPATADSRELRYPADGINGEKTPSTLSDSSGRVRTMTSRPSIKNISSPLGRRDHSLYPT
ncbi:hypothetical protein CC1G_12139 [Coprinopsis cinerea okayama7|uniref:Uncharacterized protein n=1 Tax=Coprinopsis cinerea (strain Okayama-7 / 130 / ATCC MYA-4618 / FGSC 9003) TaxID=240176 RepID=A8P6X7_COPC7|nr:hypothetical protein CC1G_12139 [Coprinopsis cinerea okayama7\|eukprot:XP_001839248.2 hypothetical protein CC1G_12139 [Coprinopsis cinerea okayama7\